MSCGSGSKWDGEAWSQKQGGDFNLFLKVAQPLSPAGSTGAVVMAPGLAYIVESLNSSDHTPGPPATRMEHFHDFCGGGY